jgi:hypothetical protein
MRIFAYIPAQFLPCVAGLKEHFAVNSHFAKELK